MDNEVVYGTQQSICFSYDVYQGYRKPIMPKIFNDIMKNSQINLYYLGK